MANARRAGGRVKDAEHRRRRLVLDAAACPSRYCAPLPRLVFGRGCPCGEQSIIGHPEVACFAMLGFVLLLLIAFADFV